MLRRLSSRSMNKTLLGVGLSMAAFAIFLLWSVAAVAHPGGLKVSLLN